MKPLSKTQQELLAAMKAGENVYFNRNGTYSLSSISAGCTTAAKGLIRRGLAINEMYASGLSGRLVFVEPQPEKAK